MKNVLMYGVLVWIVVQFSVPSAFAQPSYPQMQEVLRKSTSSSMAETTEQLHAMMNEVPFEEAVVYADGLLHQAAALPHADSAFGHLWELVKQLYGRGGSMDNLFLYLLSFEDDPAFQQAEIRTKIQYEIANSYFNIGDFGKAKITLEKFVPPKDDMHAKINRDYINSLTMLGFIAQRYQEMDAAQHYFERALRVSEAAGDTVWMGISSGNLGVVYIEKGEVERGRALIRNDIEVGVQYSLWTSLANSYLMLSSTLVDEKADPKAIRMLIDSAIHVLHFENEPPYGSWSEAYRLLSKYYEASGKWDSAFHYLQASHQLKDSAQHVHNESLLSQRIHDFNIQKKERDAQLLKAAEERSRRHLLIAIGTGVAILLVVASSWYVIRQNRKINQILRDKAKLIDNERRIMEEQYHREESANKDKNKLFSMVAHDLRGPISNLVMSFDLFVKDKALRDHDSSVIFSLKQEIDNLNDVTDKLLNWAYAQIDGKVIKPQHIYMVDRIDQIFRSLEGVARTKHISMINRCDEGLVLWADPNHIEIILRNLINNALKFSPIGSSVHIIGHIDGARILLRVVDQGPGIPAEVIQNLEAGLLSQPQKGTAGENGTGLGLAICREFVVANGGQLLIAANGPTGTIVSLLFPVGMV